MYRFLICVYIERMVTNFDSHRQS